MGILGRQGITAANTLLFFEEIEGDRSAYPAIGERDYRIIATAGTSTMEKDISEAAAEGFRVIGSGFGHMTVVMDRVRNSAPEPIEYRLIAMTYVGTAVKELQMAGAQGFRNVVVSVDSRLRILSWQTHASQHFERPYPLPGWLLFDFWDKEHYVVVETSAIAPNQLKELPKLHAWWPGQGEFQVQWRPALYRGGLT